MYKLCASYMFYSIYQVDVACGKHGAANGMGSGKGCFF
jgi:hypothetical protein